MLNFQVYLLPSQKIEMQEIFRDMSSAIGQQNISSLTRIFYVFNLIYSAYFHG
jgi:hypothetical protein